MTATQTTVPTPSPSTTSTPIPSPSITASFTPFVTTTPTLSALPSPTPTLSPDAWMSMPAVPTRVSQRVREIYQHGQELGNNPAAFSKIGDCDATPTWFLGDFDLGPQYYSLGDEYAYLQKVIDAFHGSFGRESAAVKPSFTAASVLSPIWVNTKICQTTENPLTCEIRLQRPSYAIVMLGTNDISRPEVFEPNMRMILDYLIEQGVVPILATKADNREGDHSINITIARLAYEYDLPFWNFWLAVQPLSNHGLQPDGSHLTWDRNFFDQPMRMRAAWPWRNLTALQVLNVVWQGTIQP